MYLENGRIDVIDKEVDMDYETDVADNKVRSCPLFGLISRLFSV